MLIDFDRALPSKMRPEDSAYYFLRAPENLQTLSALDLKQFGIY